MLVLHSEYNSSDSVVETSLITSDRYKQQLAHINSLIPYDQMTMEDYYDAFPDKALDPINRPTYWPHTEEDQPGYEEKNPAASH